MIWDLLVILAVVIMLVIVARRLPDARRRMQEKREISDEEIGLYGLVAQADDAFDAKDYKKAETLYVKAAVLDPDNPRIYSRLGAIYLEESNYYDARDAFLQAVRLEPDLASRHINLGLSYMGLKDYYKSMASFKKALDLDPKNKKYNRLYQKAEKFYQKESSKKPLRRT